MTKKKRNQPDLQEVLDRPWCYYCERDFDDLKILINHQKAKHFKCERCGRRLNTAGGLNVHMSQVHKEALSAVDNALGNRSSLEIEIFGMEGIPQEILDQHQQRVTAQYYQNIAEKQGHAGSAGAPGIAGAGVGQAKKPKFESPSDLKKRLAEHKARLAEQQANGGGSGNGTPVGAGQGQSPGGFQQNASQYPQQQQYPPANGSTTYAPTQPSFNGPPGAQQFPPQQPPFNGAPVPFSYSQAPPQPGAYATNGFPPQPTFSPPPNTFPGQPSNGPSFQSPQYPPLGVPGMPPFQNGPPGGVPRPYGAQSPPVPFHQGQPAGQQISRPGSLPPIPGLPQRPSVAAPHVNAYQMQQFHQGQIPGQTNSTVSQSPTGNEPSSLDELISGASRQAEEAAKAQPAPVPIPSSANIPSNGNGASGPGAPPATKKVGDEQGEEKTAKKEKDKSKASRLVYSDNDISPEEKMAILPRYAFQKVGA